MRDLTESHAAYGCAMLADLTRPDAGPGKPVDGDSGGSASDVPAGDGTGPVRAPQRPEPIRDETLFEPMFRVARQTHALIWDAALAIVRAAPPMSLVSSEPWVEGDDAYRKRLADPKNDYRTHIGYDLERVGQKSGLSRARLVRKERM